MKYIIFTFIAGLLLTLNFQTASAQTAKKLPAKESSLIAHLVKEANQPDSHSAGDTYLQVTIGKTAYTAELKSGKVVSQKKTDNGSGGFSGAYAEVTVNLLDKNKAETSQGAGQILKLTGSSWKKIALSEGDYQCSSVKSVPKSIMKAWNVECN